MKIWVPKSKILYVIDMLYGKVKAPVLVPVQWLLTTHDKRKAYVPNPYHERGRNCGIWRKPEMKDC